MYWIQDSCAYNRDRNKPDRRKALFKSNRWLLILGLVCTKLDPKSNKYIALLLDYKNGYNNTLCDHCLWSVSFRFRINSEIHKYWFKTLIVSKDLFLHFAKTNMLISDNGPDVLFLWWLSTEEKLLCSLKAFNSTSDGWWMFY